MGQIIYIYHSGLGKKLAALGKSFEKYVPKEIKSLSPRLIRIFLDAFLFCDGHERKSEWKEKSLESTERVYFTTSKRLADDIGELIVKAGGYPSYSLQKSAGEKCIFKNGNIYFKPRSLAYSGK